MSGLPCLSSESEGYEGSEKTDGEDRRCLSAACLGQVSYTKPVLKLDAKDTLSGSHVLSVIQYASMGSSCK